MFIEVDVLYIDIRCDVSGAQWIQFDCFCCAGQCLKRPSLYLVTYSCLRVEVTASGMGLPVINIVVEGVAAVAVGIL